jgi:hypothetical protein
MPALKNISYFVLSVGVLGLGTPLLLNSEIITLASRESKTSQGETVYNKIRLIQEPHRDIWMMNQSHSGPKAPSGHWDRLAIVVDKSKPTKTALFLQLPPGELVWNESLLRQKQNFRVSCYMCHSNGPRAIRPDFSNYPITWKDKITLVTWNIKIKLYGPILPHEDHEKSDLELATPFKYSSEFDDAKLMVKSCTLCHNNSAPKARGYLLRQHSIAIQFMVENSLMPPLGFELSESDRKAIDQFVRGL